MSPRHVCSTSTTHPQPRPNLSLPGVPNAALFTFNKEDHTLGNLLRAHLAKHPHVLFAGYQVPHPLFATFKFRVQTDGEISPKEAVVGACQELVKELQMLDQEFTKEWELKKIAVAGGDV
jgi:DNA-directed RNA polymerase II subunit RPB11